MDKGKVYWHEPFVAALKMVLRDYSGVLDFASEHPLGKEALVIDVLIRKAPGVEVELGIGRIFRGCNVVEYKSEDDSLSVGDFYKVMAYAQLHSTFEGADIGDMTVTFAVTMRPAKLLRHLEGCEWARLREAGLGITHIEGGFFPVQILELPKLAEDENLFIKALRRGNSPQTMREIWEKMQGGQEEGLDMRNIYLNRLIQANREAFEEAMAMTDLMLDIAMEVAEKKGRLAERDKEIARETARESARKTAVRLFGFGLQVEQISAATELPAEEVAQLAKEADAGALA